MINELDCQDCVYGFFAAKDKYLVVISFNPLTGEYMPSSYNAAYVEVMNRYFNLKDPGQKAVKSKMHEMYIEDRSKHVDNEICSSLYDLVIGDDKGTTRAIYLPMVRTYAVFRKGMTEEFDAMDYCPFCGAKLPERLDNKLLELLQKEYGLASWRDYKKAPHEFHTDEWWKKRGL